MVRLNLFRHKDGKLCFLLLFILIILISGQTYCQYSNSKFVTPVFEQLTVNDGLPENSVSYIYQDYLGYLWFGTQNGVVKYDGYSMNVYQPEETDDIKIKFIKTIYEDSKRTLWIGTINGLGLILRTDFLR